ncbi:MAG: CvpA family protein [Geminicoccaceae bacterium]
MSGVQLTLFDVVAIVIVLLSALAALLRGFVREVLGLASWLGAAILAFLALPFVTPLVQPVIAGPALASGVAAVGTFLVALVVLKMLSGMVASAIDGSALGPLDKGLGLAFGAARGAFIVCAGYLAAAYLVNPDQHPTWVRDAYFIRPVQQGADRIEALLPEAYRPRRPVTPPPTTEGQGYPDADRQGLEKLLSPQP